MGDRSENSLYITAVLDVVHCVTCINIQYFGCQVYSLLQVIAY